MKAKLLLWALAIAVAAGSEFYRYNYLANMPGQARGLQLSGLTELVCKGVEYKPGKVDQCGPRSIYGDADWGITAYFTIYGVGTSEEAETIVRYMKAARELSRQTNIPMDVEIYSSPRSAGSRPSVSLVKRQNFE